MDPFTQRMLERAKMRREKLDNHLTNSQESTPSTPPVTLNTSFIIEKDNSSNVEFNLEGKSNSQGLTGLGKMKLKKLAQFYTDKNDISILTKQKTEEEELPNLPKKNKFKSNKLAALSEKINQWEDELNHSKQFANTAKEEFSNLTNENIKRIEQEKKHLIWNSPMIEKLCSQGFSYTEKQSKLTYDFKETQEKSKLIYLQNNDSLPKIEVYCKPFHLQQENRTAKISNQIYQSSTTNKFTYLKPNNATKLGIQEKDPAELSLAERKALFERNLKDDSRLNQNFKNSPDYLVEVKTSKISNFNNCFSNEKENNLVRNKYDVNVLKKEKLCLKKISKENIKNDEENFYLNSNVNSASNNNNHTKQKEEEFQKQKNGLHFPKAALISSTATNEQEKTVKEHNDNITPSSKQRLYPTLDKLIVSDNKLYLDCSETEVSHESENICENIAKNLPETNENDKFSLANNYSFSSSKEFQVLNRMDILLENALNNTSSSDENILELSSPSPSKILKSSKNEINTINANPLLHTISFYRKQQKIRSAVNDELKENDENISKIKEDQFALAENKIQFLMTEVNKQQTIMSQASQALNLCLSTIEFSGSGEQVEGERLLLLASHKRQACLNEIQRLKIEKCLQSYGKNNFEKGDVTLSNITIQLKRDSLRSMAAAESLQYFVCLIKSEERVLATPVVSAARENLKDFSLQFPGILKLEGLLSDFKVSVEIYNLLLNKELLPHDIKYHIVNKKEKKLLTPIKSKKSESKLVKPQIQSPGGPNAVRISNFQMCGYIVFSLKEINRTHWTLNKVPYTSSLEGSVSMTIQSQLHLDDEHRGFLTMFEDISGFGAWHRRWCLLSSHIISFWKYPDDEQKKVPIGSIDLKSVTTENVGLVSRDICARLHTFLLETRRPRLNEDRNSLVLNIEDNVTVIRHLLSADSKKDMMAWCKKINTTLALLRSWKCNIDRDTTLG